MAYALIYIIGVIYLMSFLGILAVWSHGGKNALVTGERISLSEQELIDCDNSYNSGCEGGLVGPVFGWVINNGGIDSAADYPYTAFQGTCNTTRHENDLLCVVAQQPVSTEAALIFKGCSAVIWHEVLSRNTILLMVFDSIAPEALLAFVAVD
ncbi:hypothetical protein RND71_021830 [Anisodus tanguticus]|uniref:Peptidase C1A papain C-terminal domain-containing protein n=1 Tax=Anisodus tanguticus TaxID=243964 RepID=A0AAE1RZ71_9SOLA|nr:hypothetical protein RND71_021830 [Anisodus tanguticus]